MTNTVDIYNVLTEAGQLPCQVRKGRQLVPLLPEAKLLLLAVRWMAQGRYRTQLICMMSQQISGRLLNLALQGLISSAGSSNKIVFAGGLSIYNVVDNVDIYDISTNSWTTGSLSEARLNMGAAAAGNKILFAGGQTTGSHPSAAVDIYDASNNSWTTAQLSEARYGLAAAAAGNKVVFAGGNSSTNGGNKESKTVDICDISTDSWTTAELSEARQGLVAAAVGNKIFFAGGYVFSDGYIYSKTIDIYDVQTNKWTIGQLNDAINTVMQAQQIKFFLPADLMARTASETVLRYLQ